jgi:hypothetical protein
VELRGQIRTPTATTFTDDEDDAVDDSDVSGHVDNGTYHAVICNPLTVHSTRPCLCSKMSAKQSTDGCTQICRWRSFEGGHAAVVAAHRVGFISGRRTAGAGFDSAIIGRGDRRGRG